MREAPHGEVEDRHFAARVGEPFGLVAGEFGGPDDLPARYRLHLAGGLQGVGQPLLELPVHRLDLPMYRLAPIRKREDADLPLTRHLPSLFLLHHPISVIFNL